MYLCNICIRLGKEITKYISIMMLSEECIFFFWNDTMKPIVYNTVCLFNLISSEYYEYEIVSNP